MEKKEDIGRMHTAGITIDFEYGELWRGLHRSNPLSFKRPYSFTVYKDRDLYMAEDWRGRIRFEDDDASEVIKSAVENTPEGGRILLKTGIYEVGEKLTSSKEVYLEGEGKGTKIIPKGDFDALDLTNIRVINLVWKDKYGVEHDASFDPNMFEEKLISWTKPGARVLDILDFKVVDWDELLYVHSGEADITQSKYYGRISVTVPADGSIRLATRRIYTQREFTNLQAVTKIRTDGHVTVHFGWLDIDYREFVVGFRDGVEFTETSFTRYYTPLVSNNELKGYQLTILVEADSVGGTADINNIVVRDIPAPLFEVYQPMPKLATKDNVTVSAGGGDVLMIDIMKPGKLRRIHLFGNNPDGWFSIVADRDVIADPRFSWLNTWIENATSRDPYAQTALMRYDTTGNNYYAVFIDEVEWTQRLRIYARDIGADWTASVWLDYLTIRD